MRVELPTTNTYPTTTIAWIANLTNQLGLPTTPGVFPKAEDKKVGFKLFAQLLYCPSWESRMAVIFLKRLIEEGTFYTPETSTTTTTTSTTTTMTTTTTTTTTTMTTTTTTTERGKRGETGGEEILACGRTDQPKLVQEVLVDLKRVQKCDLDHLDSDKE